MKSIIAGVLIVVTVACVAHAQMPMSAEQKEVWAGEEAYCRYEMTRNLEGYMSLWDDDFVGWPLPTTAPARKSDVRRAMARNLAAGGRFECASTPLAIHVFGDVANTYYLFHVKLTNRAGKTEKGTVRITHTWRRSNAGWKIIGGMAAPLPAKRD